MKKQLFDFANALWGIAKNPVGSAVIGGLSAATATHLFNQSKQAQVLELAQSDCAKLKKRVSKVEGWNDELLIRNEKLRDELRQADKETDLIKNQLNDYKHLVNMNRINYNSSWCFWRYSDIPKNLVPIVEKYSSNSLAS